MCTAATYKTKDFYIGRTLDYEISYGDEITITPRNYEFKFKEKEPIKTHNAIIGMAYVVENYPLYYDAINEKGLGIAGLNFVGNTHYNEKQEGKDNITQYEFIPWILSQCSTVKEAKKLIDDVNNGITLESSYNNTVGNVKYPNQINPQTTKEETKKDTTTSTKKDDNKTKEDNTKAEKDNTTKVEEKDNQTTGTDKDETTSKDNEKDETIDKNKDEKDNQTSGTDKDETTSKDNEKDETEKANNP